MPFALDNQPELSEVSEAINYLLGNFATGLSSNANTGQIIGPTGETVGYLYKYIAIKYADSPDGSLNFSNSPTGRLYYGINNRNTSTESVNPADYIWYQASGGFGTTKFLWYQTTGGRQIQFAVAAAAPDTGWSVDPGVAIDLDIVTSGNIPVIVEAFVPYFSPTILQVPRSGSPLAPSFTGVTPVMYATDKGEVIPFVDAQTDTAVNFTNNTWRIGNSSTTGYADISKTNITIGDPTDAGDFAQWPTPTAMPSSPAYIAVPVRYKNSLGNVTQAGIATLQLVYADPGQNGTNGTNGSAGPVVDISGYSGFTQNSGGAFTPANATLSAITTNVTSPSYSWSISGATPTSSTASSVVVTPTSSSTGVSVTLTVNGSNLSSPISKTIQMPVVYDGVPGQAGQNGVMSAFPTIYIWTGSSAAPTRPSTTSTYTWSNGAYTAPAGWSTTAPSNTTAGNYLWSITVPLTVSATTATSTLDWTNTANPIRAIAYNGTNGANGTNGTNGTNGVNGTRTAILDVYRWSASTPTTFPSGTSTYTWATGQFTAPATLNGWSLTPPAAVAGQTLYIARQIYADTNTTSTSSVTWSTTTASVLSSAGVDGPAGVNGTRTAVIEVYKWATSTPTTFPSGTSTYTWADGSFTAPSTSNGWSLTPGAPTPGYTLYACSVSYADTNTTSTSTITWSTSSAYVVGFAGTNGNAGADGTNGTRTAILEMYKWSATAPTTFPTGTSVYTWATAQFTSPSVTNGWSLTPPPVVSGQYLWVCRTLYADTNVSATTTVTWNATTAYQTGSAGVNGADGVNGVRTAFLELYQWAASTPTNFPSGNSTYTWANGSFTSPTTPNGWSLVPGTPTPGYKLYACSVSYADTNTTATSSVSWTTTTAYVVGSAGVDGSNGTSGSNGQRTAILDVYQWSATDPTVFPSGTSIYTWATGQFTAPASLNGWSLTPPTPVAGQKLYTARQLYSDNNTSATSSVSWTVNTFAAISLAGVNGANGADGTNGTRTAVLELYRWSATAPSTFPSGTSTYTWATGQFTAPATLNGWSLTPGAPVAGQTLYGCEVIYADNGTSATTVITWNTSTSYPIGYAGSNGANGSNGLNGLRTAILDVYQWSASVPTVFPSGTSIYTWSTGQFTAPGTLNGWSLTPPNPVVGQTLYVARQLYTDTNTSSTSSVTWSTATANPFTVAGTNGANGADGTDGVNGTRTAFLEVYKWSATTPSTFPSGTSTYTWADGSFTAPATTNGWSLTPGSSSPGYFLFACSVRYADSDTTATSVVTWNTTTAYVVGAAGNTGPTGPSGSAGAATFVVTRTINDSSAPSNAEVNSVLSRDPVAGDICTVSYNNYNNATVYKYTTSWALFQTYITGSLIVQNTITADKMEANIMSSNNVLTRGLTVRDNSGNIILAAGTPLNYSNITPSSSWLNSNITINPNGTLSGAGSGQVSLGGLGAGSFATLNQITSSNVTTYIAGAAIGTAQVGVLTASNIGAQSITADKMAVGSITAANAAIDNAAVNTLQIAGNAVTIPVGASLASDTNISTQATLASVSIDSGGAPTYISGIVVSQAYGSANPPLYVYLYDGSGTLLTTTGVPISSLSSGVYTSSVIQFYVSSPGTGTKTYVLKAGSFINLGGGSVGYGVALGGKCSIFAIGTKR